MNQFLLALVSIVFFLSCSNNPCSKCDCDNVDDCLSKNKFDEAMKYATIDADGFWKAENHYRNGMAAPEAIQKVLIYEVNYWISQNQLERAIKVTKELNVYKESAKLFTDLNISIIQKYCSLGQFDEAEIFANELPEKISFSYEVHIFDYEGKEKYFGLKKGLKPNQEIEEWKGISQDYKITTYEYPQNEALKIIEKYKKGK